MDFEKDDWFLMVSELFEIKHKLVLKNCLVFFLYCRFSRFIHVKSSAPVLQDKVQFT